VSVTLKHKKFMPTNIRYTGMRRKTTFRSTTHRVYDGVPVWL